MAPFAFKLVCLFLALVTLPQVLARPACTHGKHGKPDKSGSKTNGTDPHSTLAALHDLYKTSTPYPASVPTDTSPSSPSESPPPATGSIPTSSELPSDSTPSSTPTPSSPEVPAEEPSPTTSSVEPSTPESSPTPSTSDGDDFKATALDKHNSFRALHGASPLTWNETLATAAKSWVSQCKFEHSGGTLGPFGENLAAGTGGYSVADGIKGWTDEVSEYNPENPTYSHFTQVVWKGTEQLGCASVTCDSLDGLPWNDPATFIACEYYPAGNVIGQFGENVQK